MEDMTIHGITEYRKGCRCELCVATQSRRVKEWRLRGPQSMNPEIVRQHVKRLRASGMSQRQIAELAGVSISTVDRLFYERVFAKRMLRVNAKRLLAIQPIPNPGEVISAVPSQRKIRALMCMGWNQNVIAEMSSVSRSVIWHICSGRRVMIRRSTHERISNVFQRCSMRKGPDSSIASYAMKKRYLPPLAWDDIDDLAEKPVYSQMVHYSLQVRSR